MNKPSFKRTIKTIIAVILALTIVSIPYVIGLLISYIFIMDNNVLYVISMILHGLFLILIIANGTIKIKYTKKMSKQKPSEAFNELVSIKELNTKTEEIQEKLIRNYKKEYYRVIITHIFIFITLLVHGLNYHVFSKLDWNKESFDFNSTYFTITLLIEMIMVIFVFTILLTSILKIFEKEPIKNNHDLYPNLSKLVIEEFKKEGINKDIIINITNDCNAGIYEVKGKIGINISYIFLKFLNDDEIKSIIYHEIAHYKNKDTLKSAEMYKYINRLEYLSPSNMNMFAPHLGRIAIESEMLKEVTNILFEYKADDLVLDKGLAPAYADATFKIFGLDLAFQNASYLEYSLCLSDKLTYDEELLNIRLNIIKSYYYKHLDFFTYSSKHYLSPVIITHPTIKDRLEKFDTGKEINKELILNTEFDVDINNFIKEYDKLLQSQPYTITNLKNHIMNRGSGRIRNECPLFYFHC